MLLKVERQKYLDAAMPILTEQDVILFLMGARQVGKTVSSQIKKDAFPSDETSSWHDRVCTKFSSKSVCSILNRALAPSVETIPLIAVEGLSAELSQIHQVYHMVEAGEIQYEGLSSISIRRIEHDSRFCNVTFA